MLKSRRRWALLFCLAVAPGAALPLLIAGGAKANSVGCLEVSTTPTACGSGVVGVAICGLTGGTTGPATGVNVSGAPNSASISVNAGAAGVDAAGQNIASTSPQGHAIVWTSSGAHAGVGSTTGGVVDCPE
jgi:hypothetical protein